MSDLESAVRMVIEDTKTHISEVLTDIVKVSGRVKSVVPKTPRQKTYVQFIKDYDVVFGIGPAGTGKTYLAVAMAVNMFLNKKVSRIILTRPAVEAGERLGFLPGDIADKINPYLRPLYDALYNMMDFEKVGSLIEKGVIELAPLAFMRGRTLNDAFIILDEAQNTTVEQMKMFLTRLGFNSKAVITGDITQVDLPSDKKSGLIVVRDILKDVDGLKFVDFTKSDVIRHPLVQRIINAYEEYEAKKNGN
jgi:phosphate starvation-inducible PhoH-like protein